MVTVQTLGFALTFTITVSLSVCSVAIEKQRHPNFVFLFGIYLAPGALVYFARELHQTPNIDSLVPIRSKIDSSESCWRIGSAKSNRMRGGKHSLSM